MSQENKTQLAVIGAGPGGYTAAFLAADLGMEVTLIDPAENPGGVCLYRGCIPSKALLHASGLITEAKRADSWGISFAEPKIDIDKLRSWKASVVASLTGGLGRLTSQRKVRHLRAEASFKDKNTLEIVDEEGNKDSLAFEKAIVATGSRPVDVKGFPEDDDRVWNSSAALELPFLPKKLLVVGGGYIGLELGCVYSGLGTEVTVAEMLPGLMAGADKDLVRFLKKELEERFSDIFLQTKVSEIKSQKNGLKATLTPEEGDEVSKLFDAVLVSVGRQPNSGGIGLEAVGIEPDEKGFIPVDERLRTAADNIYAIGDVAGEPMLAHKASYDARIAVEAIAGKKVVFDPAAIPAVAFTDPEIAWTGLTEAQAKEKGIKVEVARFPWAASGRAITLDRNNGMTKLVFDPETERLLGVGVVGPGAGELIAEATLALEMAANATDIGLTIHPHPTLSETFKEAAEIFHGIATHYYKPKKKKKE